MKVSINTTNYNLIKTLKIPEHIETQKSHNSNRISINYYEKIPQTHIIFQQKQILLEKPIFNENFLFHFPQTIRNLWLQHFENQINYINNSKIVCVDVDIIHVENLCFEILYFHYWQWYWQGFLRSITSVWIYYQECLEKFNELGNF